MFEELCCKGKKFIASDKLSIADFWVGGIYVSLFDNPNGNVIYSRDEWAKCMAKYPNYCAYGKRFYEANKTYLDKRNKECPCPV